MGGTIGVDTELGKGSVFRFTLPLPETECPSVPEHEFEDTHEPKREHKDLRILLAEDVETNADLLKRWINRRGHEVVWVEDGAQAIEAVKNDTFDLVLMDVQMPEVDGVTATRRIRTWEAETGNAPIPIIALTAGAFQEDRDAAEAAGMNGFVTKPIDVQFLFAEIDKVLGERAAKRQAKPGDAGIFGDGVRVFGVDISAGLARWGDEDAYRDNLIGFVTSYRDAYLTIRTSLDSGDTAAALHLIHEIRGVAANLALIRVTRVATELEKQLRGGDDHVDTLSEFFTAFRSVINAIQGFERELKTRTSTQDER